MLDERLCANERTALDDAICAARSLFSRGLATGSTGNISVRCDGGFLISQSGSSFGTIRKEDFALISQSGDAPVGMPSKEWPLHAALFAADPLTRAVIHTHSHFCTLLSCLHDIEERIPHLFAYTPYLYMKTGGSIGIVPYAPPGSSELFAVFTNRVHPSVHAYLLENHGVIVAAKSVEAALALLEEFEASARLLHDIEQWGLNAFRQIVSGQRLPRTPHLAKETP